MFTYNKPKAIIYSTLNLFSRISIYLSYNFKFKLQIKKVKSNYKMIFLHY